MASITMKGTPIHTSGELPATGQPAPSFTLVNQELKDVTLGDFKGKKKLLNIFPSIDTSVCAMSAKKFNEFAKGAGDTATLMISADLPFALNRYCQQEGLSSVIPLSMMRSKDFAKSYGLLITDGPLAGLAARAVVVLDENDKVIYTQLVPEISKEPDYDKAVSALSAKR